MAASPWPPPPHSATAAVEAPRRRSSSSAVSATRVPDMPTGWPSAMAPPLTLTLSSSIPRSSDRGQADGGEGLVDLEEVDGADVDARLLRRLEDRPRGLGQQRVVGPGHHAVARRSGRGVRRRAPWPCPPTSRRRRAPPSEICDALPAVMVPSLVEGGLERAERLGRRPRPHALVRVDQERVALALGHLHRDDLLGQPAVLDRRGGLLVAGRGEGVLALAARSPAFWLCCSVERPMAMWSKASVRPSNIMESTSVAVAEAVARRGRRAAGRAPGSSTPCRRPRRCRRRRRGSSGRPGRSC